MFYLRYGVKQSRGGLIIGAALFEVHGSGTGLVQVNEIPQNVSFSPFLHVFCKNVKPAVAIWAANTLFYLLSRGECLSCLMQRAEYIDFLPTAAVKTFHWGFHLNGGQQHTTGSLKYNF